MIGTFQRNKNLIPYITMHSNKFKILIKKLDSETGGILNHFVFFEFRNLESTYIRGLNDDKPD